VSVPTPADWQWIDALVRTCYYTCLGVALVAFGAAGLGMLIGRLEDDGGQPQ
jgi:hypothetical protein